MLGIKGRLMSKPTKMTVGLVKTLINLGICPVWSESSQCAQWVAKGPSFLHADSEVSDLTGRMPRLIWVFAGSTCHFVGFVMRWLKLFKFVLQLAINGLHAVDVSMLNFLFIFSWGFVNNLLSFILTGIWSRISTHRKVHVVMTGFITKFVILNGKHKEYRMQCVFGSTTNKNKCAVSWQNQQMACAPSDDSDQPGHLPSLIRVFPVW